MKRLLISIALTVIPFVCLAGGDAENVAVTGNSSAVTNAVESSKLDGYIEYIYIDVTAPATQTVTITSTDATILTATAVTADALYRVRYPAVDAAGTAVAGTTNIAHCLANEKLTITITDTNPTSTDTAVKFKMYNVK